MRWRPGAGTLGDGILACAPAKSSTGSCKWATSSRRQLPAHVAPGGGGCSAGSRRSPAGDASVWGAQAPTAIRAAANCFCQLLVSQSDNNVKLIVLDRLQARAPSPCRHGWRGLSVYVAPASLVSRTGGASRRHCGDAVGEPRGLPSRAGTLQHRRPALHARAPVGAGTAFDARRCGRARLLQCATAP